MSPLKWKIIMSKNLNPLISSLIIAISFASPQTSYALNAIPGLIPDIEEKILRIASTNTVLELGRPTFLKEVCKHWNSVINKKFVHKSILSMYTLSKDESKIYERFLNGKLFYKTAIEEGDRVTSQISDLWNPLKGTIYENDKLIISAGYSEGKQTENANKLSIWFVPRFLIEKELTTIASHFRDIYETWSADAPIGIFWRWGRRGALIHYDYLTTKDLDELANQNLYALARGFKGRGDTSNVWLRWAVANGTIGDAKSVHVCF